MEWPVCYTFNSSFRKWDTFDSSFKKVMYTCSYYKTKRNGKVNGKTKRGKVEFLNNFEKEGKFWECVVYMQTRKKPLYKSFLFIPISSSRTKTLGGTKYIVRKNEFCRIWTVSKLSYITIQWKTTGSYYSKRFCWLGLDMNLGRQKEVNLKLLVFVTFILSFPCF